MFNGGGGGQATGPPMTSSGLMTWQSWALLSAVFAALTAIFAKIGVAGINSDMATLIRTVIILGVLAVIVVATGQWQPLSEIPARTWVFLTLSGLGNRGFLGMLFPGLEDWRCGTRCPRRQAEHCPGCGVRRPDPGRAPVCRQLAWRGPVHGGNCPRGDEIGTCLADLVLPNCAFTGELPR